MQKHYYVYLLASKPRGVLYVGVTSNLIKRVWEHKQGLVQGFTKKYYVHRLVYFEVTCDVLSAIQREKRLRVWKRGWKIRIIEEMNPEWNDLYYEL